MDTLFSSADMALGYAKSRPAVHPHVMSRIMSHLNIQTPVHRALDVGCGAGLSTRVLEGIAQQCYGIDPVEAMVKSAPQVAPHASFAVAAAEFLPFSASSIHLITAAGSLNYTNLDLFFPEAIRVLAPGCMLVVYDFSQGRSFKNEDTLDIWFNEFRQRYPAPPNGALALNPDKLQLLDSGFQTEGSELFQVGLTMAKQAYVDYMMTETNVAYAIANGATLDQVTTWCNASLEPVFAGNAQEVLFNGYIVYLQKP